MNALNIPDQFRDTPSATEKKIENVTQISQDPELAAPHFLFYLVGLLRRAKVVEKGTIQLLTSLMTISGDERLVEKIGMTEKFPGEFEAEYICHAVGELRLRVDELERWRDARLSEGGEAAAAAAAARETRRKQMQNQVRSIFDSILVGTTHQANDDTAQSPENFSRESDAEFQEKPNTEKDEKDKHEDPVSSMYQDMSVYDIHNSIRDEVRMMKIDFKGISEDHQKIRATFGAMKGQLSWNLLCKCFEEILAMKKAIDQMTEGNLEYVDPNEMNVLVEKLMTVEDSLLNMDDALHKIPKKHMRKMMNLCCPILHFIGGAEDKDDVLQSDIAAVRDITERTSDQKVVIEYCSELIADMISQLGKRMLILWRLETKLEMLIEVKADKEYFFRIIDEKADKNLVNELVSECFLDKEYKHVCSKLCDYLLMIMKKMMVWIETLKVLQKAVDCSIEEEELDSIEGKLLKRLDYLKNKVADLDEGYKNYKKNSNRFEMRPFQDLSCFADDTPAVMYNKFDAGIPIAYNCPVRKNMGPQVALNVCELRGRDEWQFNNKPCVEEECPRDFKEQLVCPTCLGQSAAPCKHVKREQHEGITYIDIEYADQDDFNGSSDEDEFMSKEERQKTKEALEVARNIVRDLLKGIF